MENITLTLNKKEVIKRIGDIIQVIVVIGLMFFLIGLFPKGILVFLIIIAIYVLPSVFLLIEYLNYTLKIKEIIVSPAYINIQYKNAEQKQIFYSDIEVVILYKATSKDKGGYTIAVNAQYYFALIITKEKLKIPLTSLFGPALDDALEMMKDVPFMREKTGFAYVFKMND